MSKVSLLVKVTVHDGKGDEFAASFDEMFEQVETEPGTEMYVLNRATDDPNLFWFFELYTDGAALGAHAGSEAMAKVMGALGQLVASSDMVMSSPLKAKGITTA